MSSDLCTGYLVNADLNFLVKRWNMIMYLISVIKTSTRVSYDLYWHIDSMFFGSILCSVLSYFLLFVLDFLSLDLVFPESQKMM